MGEGAAASELLTPRLGRTFGLSVSGVSASPGINFGWTFIFGALAHIGFFSSNDRLRAAWKPVENHFNVRLRKVAIRISVPPVRRAYRRRIMRTPFLLGLIWALTAGAFLSTGVFVSADAKPISQIQGSNWKTDCQKQGGSMYGCCKGKEQDCRSGCQSGNSCGNACTQCKNECSASYSTCTAKAVKTDPGLKGPKPGTLKAN